MRRLCAVVIAGALLASAGDASAAYYYISNGTYFITGNVDPPRNVHRTRAEGADVAFFTPVAGYQRAGFQCVPLVEISKVNGKLSKRQGTACRALTAQ
jgi:hypothetical protein